MKKVIWGFLVSVLTLSLVVFGSLAITRAQGDPKPESDGLQIYEGEGYWFLYPVDATLEMDTEIGIRILGPEIAIRPARFDFTISGSAYQVEVVEHENPDLLPVEDWARQEILAEWEAAMAEGAPNIYPVTEEGQIDENKVETTTIAGLPAFKAYFFGGDADVVAVAVGHGDIVIVFRYREEIIENNPLAIMQQSVYSLLMSTLEFEAME